MKSERSTLSLPAVLLVAGLCGANLAERTLSVGREMPDARPLERFFSKLQGGGMFIADGSWLMAYLSWQRQEEQPVRHWLGVALAAEPASTYFRVNAARMLAYDVPAWRELRSPEAPAAVVAQWRRAAADEALDLLLPAAQDQAQLWIEAGNLALHARGDWELAATCYGRAAALPDAPWYAGRIYARLLHENGRTAEAVEWLRHWLPRLPENDPAAARKLVALRLEELEEALRVRAR